MSVSRKKKKQPTEQELCHATMLRAQQDPEWFVREILGREPWAKQTEILEAVRDHDEVSVKSCHNSGKTWDAANIVLWFLCAFPHSLVITTAPTDRQVRNLLWREIRDAYAKSKFPLGGKILTQMLEFEERWYAIGFTAAEYDSDRFQGWHAPSVLVVIDEAAGVSKGINEAIDGILSGAHCRKLQIGNPTDVATAFGESFKTPGVHKITISAFDTPNFTEFGITQEDIKDGSWEQKVGTLPYPSLVTPQWVSKRYKRWRSDSPMYQARVLGQFPKQGKNTMFTLTDIEAAVERTLEPGNPVELGVDVARFGDDETVIYRRQGPVFRLQDSMSKEDSVQVEGRIIAAHKELGSTSIKIDGVGIGGSGPVDHLKDQGLPIVDVVVSHTADDEELFDDLRTEIAWALKERFEEGDIDLDPEDEVVQQQLAVLTYRYTAKGRLRLVSKDELKAKRIESPDRFDAMALCNYTGGEGGEAIFDVW